MRNFLLFTTLVGMSFQVYAAKVPGTIISRGKSTDVMFEIKTPFLAGEPNFERLQYKIKYYDDHGKKIVLRPDNADEVRFRYDGAEVRMISCPNTFDEKLFSASLRIFLKLEIDGPLRLYRFYFRKVGASNGAAPGTTYVANDFIFQKENGPLKQPKGMGWRKDMTKYFSDCPTLGERIENKDLRRKEIEAIVTYYNQNCGKR